MLRNIHYIWPMLKSKYVAVLALIAGLAWGCNAPYHKPDDATEAGRDFINATLKADYGIADAYILRDALNENLYKRYKESYNTLPDSVKARYKTAATTIYDVHKVDDSTTIITFANSYYKNRRNNLRLVRNKGEWWVDFAYTFTDSLNNNP
jgi:hypothetical protein